ncbi:hypothetical protein ALQ08_200030 [Pseudomonas syringae pv. delphinii]|uniref:Uncharacterized protein n=2 Tax=Pseudomonas TaxID=286 RepID=A0A3M4JVV0_9PSED|nr:hypothetical protein ALQ08_200030 [Pseudomonas syringae pv. delphinii]
MLVTSGVAISPAGIDDDCDVSMMDRYGQATRMQPDILFRSLVDSIAPHFRCHDFSDPGLLIEGNCWAPPAMFSRENLTPPNVPWLEVETFVGVSLPGPDWRITGRNSEMCHL